MAGKWQHDNPTNFEALLQSISEALRMALSDRLVGLYLYGSVVWGDFDPQISDIDLLAAVSEDIDERQFVILGRMYEALVQAYPQWNDRLEIAYVPLHALRTIKIHAAQFGIISPGEPFHIKSVGTDWILNWYLVRERGRALIGPDPRSIIAPISKDEFLQAVRTQAREWREWVYQTRASRAYQGYAILTLCRALYVHRNGEQVSKKRAAEWAIGELPDRAAQIRSALEWRKDYRSSNVDPQATFAATAQFVNHVISLMD